MLDRGPQAGGVEAVRPGVVGRVTVASQVGGGPAPDAEGEQPMGDGAERVRPYEVPINYRARTREEGKKITWRDGVEAFWILARERARRVS